MYTDILSKKASFWYNGGVSEKYIYDRIVFPHSGDQRSFLLSVKNYLGTTWDELAKLLNFHSRTIRDWTREKHCMPYVTAQLLAQKAAIQLPQGTKVKVWKDHLRQAGIAGGKALVKKHHGRVAKDEKHRLKKWQQWWEEIGKHNFHPMINQPLPIRRPKISQSLAEFVGIMLGDGGIAQMQVVITLHRYDDKEFSHHVRRLIEKLFGVVPGIHKSSDALADDIVVSRVALVRFCVNELGLKLGNKIRQKADIPSWIKQDEKLLKACVRGLIDTDGSVFTHRYRVNGKQYKYKKLSFTSASEPLRQSVFSALASWELHPRLSGNRDVRLDSQESMRKYFSLISSHNPKHLKRYWQ